MSKEKLKNRGITLIALIITIIVMLILTGVTLSITLGDNGLVNKAKEASTQTQVAMDRELLLSAVVGAIGNDGKVNLSEIVLPEGFTGSNGTYTSKNGNAFSVSENGEIVYTGDSGSGTEIENVDLNGKYYFDIDNTETYWELRNSSTMVMVDSGEELIFMPIDIDYENQTITATSEYEDSSTNEIVVENFILNYKFIIQEDKIVNIYLLIDSSIFFKNENGFEYDLSGTYLSNDGRYKAVFNTEGILERQYKDTMGNWTWDSGETADISKYAKINEEYYIFNGMELKVSTDKNTVEINEETYTKQSN